MDYLSITAGLVAVRCQYFPRYDDNRAYPAVCFITSTKSVVISYDDAMNLFSRVQAIESRRCDPVVVGVNNYLDFSERGSWNQYVYADYDSIKFGNDAEPIDVRRFSSVLQKVVSGQCLVNCYRDKSDRCELRFWARDCQFYLSDEGMLYFVPIIERQDWLTSDKMDNIVEVSELVREALRTRKRGRLREDIY